MKENRMLAESRAPDRFVPGRSLVAEMEGQIAGHVI
ncbi:putative N-acetyltransferase YhbS [Deinococcus radiopugnans ATCC 19172]|uniref:N-acetyltransferase YhbS n=1 Tax=Deinococcus radiopugnans ATCC 19172 TaxID=585398 RepID=A0ABR6NP47_9DEIO|nr:putative N-acetyltransferase YhbS [Deinococcus radiopugnans ATCC 19172]